MTPAELTRLDEQWDMPCEHLLDEQRAQCATCVIQALLAEVRQPLPDLDPGDRYRFLTEPALPPFDLTPALPQGRRALRREHQATRIKELEAECEGLRARVAELEETQTLAMAADRDLQALLTLTERIRTRLLVAAPDRWTLVYRLRYPTDASPPWTLRQIGRHLGVSTERARQLVLKAEERYGRPR